MGIELYFDSAEIPLIIQASTLSSLRQRGEDSRILVEGLENFTVNLPSLNGLLEAIGGPRLEELMLRINTLERWRVASVQHYVGGNDGTQDGMSAEPNDADEEEPDEWTRLYENRRLVEAEECASRTLVNETEGRKRARLYNDRGYIRYGLQEKEEAKRDLQRALDLHYYHMPLTLSNLGVAYLDDGELNEAMTYIEDAIFLTLNSEDVSAGYLRLRLPTGYRAPQANWEQHPANVLEASYINLGFALMQSGTAREAIDVIEEGIALMPSSVRLKHALARSHLSLKRVDLAEPIYQDIAQQEITDPILANEIRAILRSSPGQRSRGRG
jgi:tetratricopeptide (TPR) repeat protein